MFYTYLWLRYNGTPYYVGKGKGKRAFRKGGPKDINNILLQEFPCETDVIEAEKFLIAYYGRKDLGTGCLRNLTDGGEGVSGFVFDEESRKRNSARNKGKKLSKEIREKISKALSGKPKSKEHSIKVGQANLGRKRSLESCRKISLAKKNMSIETRNKLRLAKLGIKRGPHSEATKLKISLGQLGKTMSIESRIKMSKAKQGIKRGPYNKNKKEIQGVTV